MTMREMVGDLWQQIGYKAITTNGIVRANGRLVMGAGVALECKNRIPDIDILLGGYVTVWGNRCFIVEDWKIITFPTKNSWKDLSSFELIQKSCRGLMQILDKYQIPEVFLTRPGCGNGGRSWKVVKELINPLLDGRIIIISRFD